MPNTSSIYALIKKTFLGPPRYELVRTSLTRFRLSDTVLRHFYISRTRCRSLRADDTSSRQERDSANRKHCANIIMPLGRGSRSQKLITVWLEKRVVRNRKFTVKLMLEGHVDLSMREHFEELARALETSFC